MKMYLYRILKDRMKLAAVILLFLIPSMEIVQMAWHFHQGFSMLAPHYATFLSCNTIRHFLHKIMFWYLPVFVLIIANEDSIEDGNLGYRNVLEVRCGKKDYIKTKLAGSFAIVFLTVCLGLLLNMGLAYICFRNGTYTMEDSDEILIRDIEIITKAHPVAANLVYIVIASFLAGLLASAGTALAISVKDRKLVYGLTFIIWFVPVIIEDSVMYVIQPFIGVNYEHVVPTFSGVVFSYIAIIGAAVWAEVRDDEL